MHDPFWESGELADFIKVNDAMLPDLLPGKLKKHLTKNKMLDSETNSIDFKWSRETEAGSAEKQPARDSRTEGNDREESKGILPVSLIIFFAMP